MNVVSRCNVDTTVHGLLAAVTKHTRTTPGGRAGRRPTVGAVSRHDPPDRRGAYRSVVNTSKRYRISPPDDSPDARPNASGGGCGALPRW